MAEHDLAKVEAAGSTPVPRSSKRNGVLKKVYPNSHSCKNSGRRITPNTWRTHYTLGTINGKQIDKWVTFVGTEQEATDRANKIYKQLNELNGINERKAFLEKEFGMDNRKSVEFRADELDHKKHSIYIANRSSKKYKNRGYTEAIATDYFESKGYTVINKGKPDLILLKDGTIEFIEIKGVQPDRGKEALYPEQKQAIDLLNEHGFDAKVIYIEYPKS